MTLAAQQKLRRLLEDISEYPAIPGLLWSRNVESGDQRWTVGFYDRRVVEGADFVGVIAEAGGIEFVSPQCNLVVHLEGMELDWHEGGFLVKPRKSNGPGQSGTH